jgi:DNA-binding transcriptional MerR regulator
MNTVETQIPRKLYRMGEIVQHTGLSRQTVHNYTTMGLIRESEWTPGGHRLYDETVFGRLSQISNLKKTMKMEQILDVLKGEVQPE